MLIHTQDRLTVVILESLTTIQIRATPGFDKEIVGVRDDPAKSIFLGRYDTEERAIEVLGEIFGEYGRYKMCEGGPLATMNVYVQPFAFDPPKVYAMPQK